MPEVIDKPVKHILHKTTKELHGWYPGKRECTAERMLINPYNGCSHNCFFCYARALPGNFQKFREEGITTVCEDFDKVIARQLDSINVASCGYLSPVTDPFQPLNDKYHLSEKIVKEFVSRNIPIEFITKGKVPQEVIDLIKEQPHSFGQVSILTLEEDLGKILTPGGAKIEELLDNLERLSRAGIHTVARLDPIFPYLSDDKKKLEQLVGVVLDRGANHIIASCLDIPLRISKEVMTKLKENFGAGLVYDYRRLYSERIDNSYHAEINYRKKLFDLLRNICERRGVSFALCMEYELIEGKPEGLNREFASSLNCEGIDIPVYIREGKTFKPATDCKGACLFCKEAKCGIEDLAMGRSKDTKKDWKLSDYKRWSKQIHEKELF